MLSSPLMLMLPRLKCRSCQHSFDISRKMPWCDCGGVFDLDFVPDQFAIDEGAAGLWRYAPMLQVPEPISLGEPMTPVATVEIAGRPVAAKLEYLLPSGSFK